MTFDAKTYLPGYIALCILLFPLTLRGQWLADDTVKINEVVISGKKSDIVMPGFKIQSVDTSIIEKYSLGSLAEVISVSTSVFVKNYGCGGTATASFRGMGATGTQVTWNGIRIDNPMLGQSDLSILSAGIVNKVNIYTGGASMIQNGGASGGIISLESKPDWSGRRTLIFNPLAGSFGKYSGMISGEFGTEKLQSVTRAYISTAENNFTYLDNVSRAKAFHDIRKNNEVKQNYFIQELYSKTASGYYSVHFWYQDAHRNLPSSILSEYAGEKQDDKSLRLLLHYENDKSFFITGSWIKGELDYRNRLASIDSRNRSDSRIIKTGFKKHLGIWGILDILLNEEYNKINTNNYDGKAARNSLDVAFAVKNINDERYNGSLLVRQILFNRRFLVPDFSAGLKMEPFRSRTINILANLSKNSRIPTMNDLYWNPGGNPALKNEYTLTSELGFGLAKEISLFELQYDVTFFYNSIKDMIQWRPGDLSYWTATNINDVHTRGIETSASLSLKKDEFTVSLKASYSYTKAEDQAKSLRGTQLMYVPVNLANTFILANYGGLQFSWHTGLTGKRFTTANNEDFLPSYIINDVSLGYRHKTSWGLFDASFDIDNVFGIDYQNIAYFPLPGRSFSLRLLAQLNLKK
ncbi:MAG TPA: TonB-dependent receptor [Bacteroidales bacterium]|nr:TonB-dependent receptor [Bacteroidales bacterium]